MEVILSIKPQFARLIFEGKKKFEFRRTIFKNTNITKVIVYASSPISKIIGEFEIESIIKDELNALWENTQKYSGISIDFYRSYFDGMDFGYAIKIQRPKKYEEEVCIREGYGIHPPQSFTYVKKH